MRDAGEVLWMHLLATCKKENVKASANRDQHYSTEATSSAEATSILSCFPTPTEIRYIANTVLVRQSWYLFRIIRDNGEKVRACLKTRWRLQNYETLGGLDAK